MSTFSYADYLATVEAAKKYANSTQNPSQKIGFFSLKNDGDEALVRINCSTPEDLDFETVHWVKSSTFGGNVDCLHGINSFKKDDCDLCRVAADPTLNPSITVQKAKKRVYVKMLVSYRDRQTGTWAVAQPTVWDRPAGFVREILNKLRDFGDLRHVLLKITRNGVVGDTKTTYSIDYAMPTVFKPELIAEDFSAFDNFEVSKHSYYVKTPEEIATFLTTGSFPASEIKKTEQYQQASAQQTPIYTPPTAPVQTFQSASQAATSVAKTQAAANQATSVEQKVEQTTEPKRNFNLNNVSW